MTSPAGLLAAALLAGALWLAWPWPRHGRWPTLLPPPDLDRAEPGAADGRAGAGEPTGDWVARGRVVWAAAAAVGALTLLPAPAHWVIAPLAAIGVWRVAARAESSAQRRQRERTAAELPHLVELLGAGLDGGLAPAAALRRCCQELPGAGAEALAPTVAALDLGADPVEAWSGAPESLDQLARTMVRAHVSGAPVVEAVRALADDLAQRRRLDAEDAARQVGVRAAVPLGLCLLPAFLLLGIVPLAAGAIAAIGW